MNQSTTLHLRLSYDEVVRRLMPRCSIRVDSVIEIEIHDPLGGSDVLRLYPPQKRDEAMIRVDITTEEEPVTEPEEE